MNIFCAKAWQKQNTLIPMFEELTVSLQKAVFIMAYGLMFFLRYINISGHHFPNPPEKMGYI
jgi:hypothetical protein